MGLAANKIPILEEFVSVQGEGRNLGRPYYFIRVGGCPLRCNFCDTERSWIADPASIVDIEQVVDRAILNCSLHNIEWISITGGEPMLYPKQMLAIIEKLKRHDSKLKIHIETSGALYNWDVHDSCDIYSPDAKTPCTGENRDGFFKGIENIRSQDQVKCLISDKNDLIFAHSVNRAIAHTGCVTVLQPFNTGIVTSSTKNMSADQIAIIPSSSPDINQTRHSVGDSLQNLLLMFHDSHSTMRWTNVVITPQIHVLAYGNKPLT